MFIFFFNEGIEHPAENLELAAIIHCSHMILSMLTKKLLSTLQWEEASIDNAEAPTAGT
jgi:hypothetical protein